MHQDLCGRGGGCADGSGGGGHPAGEPTFPRKRRVRCPTVTGTDVRRPAPRLPGSAPRCRAGDLRARVLLGSFSSGCSSRRRAVEWWTSAVPTAWWESSAALEPTSTSGSISIRPSARRRAGSSRTTSRRASVRWGASPSISTSRASGSAHRAAGVHHALVARRQDLVRSQRGILPQALARAIWALDPSTGGGFGHGLLAVGRVE